MDPHHENEGFETSVDSFQVIELKELGKISQKKKQEGKQEKLLQPPISTYVHIKNCPTPLYLNHAYSFERVQKVDSGNKRNVPKSSAWSTNEQKFLSQQFNKDKYKIIYNKFKEDRVATQKFYQQYSRHEYKTFTDEDSFSEEESLNEEIKEGKKKCYKYKLDLLKMEDIIPVKIKDLVFRSNFESGNLLKVYKKLQLPKINSCRRFNQFEGRKNSRILQKSLSSSTNNESSSLLSQPPQKQYYLLISNDTNTNGFNQWFYFKVYNPNPKDINANFIVVNLSKKTIPCIDEIGINCFSQNDHKQHGLGWGKIYDGISINNKNNLKKDSENFYHTLQFQAKIKKQDTVYFSLTLPYTFSKLKEFVEENKENFEIIGRTFCGNPLYVYKTGNPQANKSILITARQHPSQTSSSYVVEGIINRVSKISPLLNILKKKYQIYVIPMINPDGVIHGNSRTNLFGYDINRKWEQFPNKKESYEVSCIVHRLIKKIPKVQYLIDLHGHSKKLNSFAYFSTKKSIATVIGLEMAQKLPWFKISDCQMATTAPLNTLRWYSATQLRIERAITLQTSIHGWSDESGQIQPFTPQKMLMIGSTLIDAICQVQMQKKSTLKSIKNIQFAQCHQSSDSDPQRDYIKKQEPVKEQSPPLTRNRSHTYNQQTKKNTSPPVQKLRIKTEIYSTFYKQIINSPIRQRTKTQYAVQKLNLQMEKLPETNPPLNHNRRKITQIKYYRIRDNRKISNLKFAQKYCELSNLLNCESAKYKDNVYTQSSPRKQAKMSDFSLHKLKVEQKSLETMQKSIFTDKNIETEQKQKVALLKSKLKSNLLQLEFKKY